MPVPVEGANVPPEIVSDPDKFSCPVGKLNTVEPVDPIRMFWYGTFGNVSVPPALSYHVVLFL